MILINTTSHVIHLQILMKAFSDALNLSRPAKQTVYAERSKYLGALFYLMTSKLGITAGAQKYGSLLMMASSVQVRFFDSYF